ncbi:leucine rich repeat family protein [Stylonychia lemnae]|uniref:Leucine rich repeat family protein n=1 Tax=Stylonychia lemnae TaxID=5949 RepID=A0A078B0F3_STYLE|nr:leucine rich repeat family protein [Stylonychia lemnae]|eukprot:CDW87999.1 leucine rich repeat family protein [Stylonychia lemnae]
MSENQYQNEHQVLQNKTSQVNNQMKESLLYDIPSAVLNNLVDENGNIREDAEIPQEILQIYQNKFPKNNRHSNKLKQMTSTMTSFQTHHTQSQRISIASQKENQISFRSPNGQQLPSASNIGLTEQIIKIILNTPSLHTVKELDIDGPRSPYIFNKIQQPLVNLPNLTHLTLTNHQIERIENLSFLTQLKYLNMKGNRISVIERLESLKHLQTLNLSSNLIEKLPYQVFTRLQILENLDLSNNKIKTTCEIKALINNKIIKSINFSGNEIIHQGDYQKSIRETLPELTQLDNEIFRRGDDLQSANKGSAKPGRAKSECKIAKQQKKLLSLNFNLEKQIFDQSKKIKKQDQELHHALEYATGLEEELLNIKINSLYNQSAMCSPRITSNQSDMIQVSNGKNLSPSMNQRMFFPGSTTITNLPILQKMCKSQQQLSNTPTVQSQSKLDGHTIELVTTQNDSQSLQKVSKNLARAFNDTFKKKNSIVSVHNYASLQGFLPNDFKPEQYQTELKNQIDSEKETMITKIELLKTKLSNKNDFIKQLDYQIKDIMVKIMDLNTKISVHCDSIMAFDFDVTIQKVLDERVKYIKKHIMMRIDAIKKKNKIMLINEQLSFLNMELSFHKQNGQQEPLKSGAHIMVQSLISSQSIQQLGQIIQFLKLKLSKIQSDLQDLENKIKISSQMSKQELMDQSIYDFYQQLDINPSSKQLLKQNEYDLQKWLKKFNKNEKIIEQKQKSLETIYNHEQIQLIQEFSICIKQLNEKNQIQQELNEQLRVQQEEQSQKKIQVMLKRIKSIEAEKKKLTQRLVIRRNENLINKTEKEEIDAQIVQIDKIITDHKELFEQSKQQQAKVNAKRSLSPAPQNNTDSIINLIIQNTDKLLSVIEHLKKDKTKQLIINTQTNNDLDAYLQNTSIISPNRPEMFGAQNPNMTMVNNSMMRTFDNNNPLTVTSLNNNGQNQNHQEIQFYRDQILLIKQQLAESENERDQLSIDFINKKENYEQILRNIREQITEKESKYNQLFKDMQGSIQELQKKNNEMIKLNSDLIKRVCTSEKDDMLKQSTDKGSLSQSTQAIRRLEWYVQMQSGIVEDLVKQKQQLESKFQQLNLKNQHDIERISTSGDLQSSRMTYTMDNRSQQESFNDKQFQSYDCRLIQNIFQNPMSNVKQPQSRDMASNLRLNTELTSNTENNIIKHLFEVFSQNYLNNMEVNLFPTQTSQLQDTNIMNASAMTGFNQAQSSQNIQFNKHTQSAKTLASKEMPPMRPLSKQQSVNTTRDSARMQNKKKFSSGLQSRQSEGNNLKVADYTINNNLQHHNQISQSNYNTNNMNIKCDNSGVSFFEGADSDIMMPQIETALQSTFNKEQYSFNQSNSGGSNSHCGILNNSTTSRLSMKNVWTVGQNNQKENMDTFQNQIQINQQHNLQQMQQHQQITQQQTFGKQSSVKSLAGPGKRGSSGISLQTEKSQQSSQYNQQQIQQEQAKIRNMSNVIKTGLKRSK